MALARTLIICSVPSSRRSFREALVVDRTLSISSPVRGRRVVVALAMDSSPGADTAVPTKGDTKETNLAVGSARATDGGGPAEATEPSRGDPEWIVLHTNAETGSADSGARGGLPLPNIPLSIIPVWARWVLGTVFCVAIPLYKRMRRIEEKVEKAAEAAIEIVEKVAEVTEKVASEVADAAPGDGNIKEAALKIEKIAENVDKDAEKAEAILHKVDEIREDVDALINPIIKEGEAIEKENQEAEEAKPSTDESKNTGESNDHK